jgi:restriction endonuclease
LEKAYAVSTKGFTETITEALDQYIKNNKSELELLEDHYESLILEATRLKAKIDELTKKNLKLYKKEVNNNIEPKNKANERQLTDKERQKLWEFTIWPIVKKKISEVGIEKVISDERMLTNFSKGLCISTGELKEKICINAGVV